MNICLASAANLKSILCNKKLKLLPGSYPRAYKYIGETKKIVLAQSSQHQEDNMAGKWETSGPTEHTKFCHGQFNLLRSRTLD